MDGFLEFLLSPRFIWSAVTVIVAAILFSAIEIVKRKVRNSNKYSVGEAATLVHIGINIIKVLIILIAFFIILYCNGINITALLAGLGIVSAIVGLALQDLIKDYIMGFHIISDHFLAVGEVVEYNGHDCVVITMTLKSVKLGDVYDHSIYTVCNREIVNMHRYAGRLKIVLPLGYGEDPDKVNSVLCDIAEKIKTADNVENCEYEGIENFEASAITHRLMIYCPARERHTVKSSALLIIIKTLKENNIPVPFNQIDVHYDMKK